MQPWHNAQPLAPHSTWAGHRPLVNYPTGGMSAGITRSTCFWLSVRTHWRYSSRSFLSSLKLPVLSWVSKDFTNLHESLNGLLFLLPSSSDEFHPTYRSQSTLHNAYSTPIPLLCSPSADFCCLFSCLLYRISLSISTCRLDLAWPCFSFLAFWQTIYLSLP